MDLLKKLEEEKRERNWDPKERWRVIQETITWAEAQLPVRHNTPQFCKEKEARILKGMAEYNEPFAKASFRAVARASSP